MAVPFKPEDIEIRYPCEDDIKALAALEADARTETGHFEKRHQILYREISLSKSPRKFFLVLTCRKRIIGFIRALASLNPLKKIWWIEGLEIKEDMRRYGLGTRLIKEALYSIYHRGCKKVFLEVDKDNEPAIAFYKKLQFVPAKGLTAGLVGKLHQDKTVLMIDLEAHRHWISSSDSGYRFMGIK